MDGDIHLSESAFCVSGISRRLARFLRMFSYCSRSSSSILEIPTFIIETDELKLRSDCVEVAEANYNSCDGFVEFCSYDYEDPEKFDYVSGRGFDIERAGDAIYREYKDEIEKNRRVIEDPYDKLYPCVEFNEFFGPGQNCSGSCKLPSGTRYSYCDFEWNREKGEDIKIPELDDDPEEFKMVSDEIKEAVKIVEERYVKTIEEEKAYQKKIEREEKEIKRARAYREKKKANAAKNQGR